MTELEEHSLTEQSEKEEFKLTEVNNEELLWKVLPNIKGGPALHKILERVIESQVKSDRRIAMLEMTENELIPKQFDSLKNKIKQVNYNMQDLEDNQKEIRRHNERDH